MSLETLVAPECNMSRSDRAPLKRNASLARSTSPGGNRRVLQHWGHQFGEPPNVELRYGRASACMRAFLMSPHCDHRTRDHVWKLRQCPSPSFLFYVLVRMPTVYANAIRVLGESYGFSGLAVPCTGWQIYRIAS